MKNANGQEIKNDLEFHSYLEEAKKELSEPIVDWEEAAVWGFENNIPIDYLGAEWEQCKRETEEIRKSDKITTDDWAADDVIVISTREKRCTKNGTVIEYLLTQIGKMPRE